MRGRINLLFNKKFEFTYKHLLVDSAWYLYFRDLRSLEFFYYSCFIYLVSLKISPSLPAFLLFSVRYRVKLFKISLKKVQLEIREAKRIRQVGRDPAGLLMHRVYVYR